jgi:crotonobetainyl-CoA:carnitine CoA-transferase CaiB-like acyl-CoA transferase
MFKPLAGMRVVTLAQNLPGPLAAKRLVELGAAVIKVEPPSGDPFEQYCPEWYCDLNSGQQHQTIDLKSAEGQQTLEQLLSEADLLLTAQRPAALTRLGLDWERLHKDHPNLNHLAIVGYPEPMAELAGHDLTYQASLGLVTPPNMPKTLIADMAGAEYAALQALALLMVRKAGEAGEQKLVALSDAAEYMAQPLKYGLSSEGTILSGELPEYSLYETQSGWVAIAALEPHFKSRLQDKLGIELFSRELLAEKMKERTTQAWSEWADENDIPLVEVKR